MIDPKYADLPGIAYDQPDIYETDDVSESEQFQDCMPDDGDSVDKININATDAFNKFKDKIISNQSKTEKKEFTNDETPLERYQRIKREVQELKEQIGTIKDNTKGNEEFKSLTDILQQIETTEKELSVMNVDKLLSGKAVATLHNNQEIYIKELQSQIEIFKQKENIKSNYPSKKIDLPTQGGIKNDTLKYQMIYLPDKAKLQDNARLSNLEKRLGHLESVVGISNDNAAKISQILKAQGMVQSIEKLMANACLLDSSQLDILENKVSSLLGKMDSVQKKSLTSQETKYEKTILELYDLVKEYENSSQTLPQTVDRMLSLSGLHSKAAEFFNQLKELEDLQQSISGSLVKDETLLIEMQKHFSSNLDVIMKDISSLNERIKKLKK